MRALSAKLIMEFSLNLYRKTGQILKNLKLLKAIFLQDGLKMHGFENKSQIRFTKTPNILYMTTAYFIFS
jgi:hypothetical protein